MGRELPILFNTDMVQAILDGRKTVTRRIVKGNVVGILNSPFHKEHPKVPDKVLLKKLCKAPYHPGDTLYVREAYCPDYFDFVTQYGSRNAYKADYDKEVLSSDIVKPKWTPSIHMPKEAARIWLKVTDVRVERLHEILIPGMRAEGAIPETVKGGQWQQLQREYMKPLWDSTIKKKDLDLYGWDANPWVWVIEFKRCGKPD